MRNVMYISILFLLTAFNCKSDKPKTPKVPDRDFVYSNIVIDTSTTIQEGFRMLGNKDTLYLRKGTYREMLDNIIPNNKVLSGYGAEKPIIKPDSGSHPSGLGVMVMGRKRKGFGSRITLKNLIIDGSNLTNSAVKITDSAINAKLLNVELRNTWRNGILINQGADSILINGCYIHHIGVFNDSVNFKFANGIYIAASHGIIKNTRIDSIAGNGINMYTHQHWTADYNGAFNNKISNTGLATGENGNGIMISRGKGHYAHNNEIDGSDIGISARYDAIDPKIWSNRIKNCLVAIRQDSSVNLTHYANIIDASSVKIKYQTIKK